MTRQKLNTKEITAYEKIIMDIVFIQEDVFYSCASVVVVIIKFTTITEVILCTRNTLKV